MPLPLCCPCGQVLLTSSGQCHRPLAPLLFDLLSVASLTWDGKPCSLSDPRYSHRIRFQLGICLPVPPLQLLQELWKQRQSRVPVDTSRQGFQEAHSLLHTTNTTRVQPGGHQDAPMATRQGAFCYEKASERDPGSTMTMSSVADIPKVSWAAVGGKNKMPKRSQNKSSYNTIHTWAPAGSDTKKSPPMRHLAEV